MLVSDLEHFRDILLERHHNLSEWLNSTAFMRDGDVEKVRQLLSQIRDALKRIETASYGECKVCHGYMEMHRLEVQPVNQVCLACISDDEKKQLEEDLFLASKIHRALLPQTVPSIEGFELGVRSLAAANIGGDYFDFLPGTNNQSVRIVIADVMGHGLPAGFLMSNLQGALRILSPDFDSPGPLIARLNEWLCRNIPVTKFVSMIGMNLENTSSGETKVTYTNAGHPLPVVLRSDDTVERLEVTGGVLGVNEDFDYDEADLELRSGDTLMLYTDGIVEAENEHGDVYGEDRLIELVRGCRERLSRDVVDVLMNSVVEFSCDSRAADDLTALVLFKK